MYGAILGDIIGSPFEFDRGNKTKDFELFTKGCYFTDDTVMTIAVAEALLSIKENSSLSDINKAVTNTMHEWGNRYPNAGYGYSFYQWLKSKNPKPYGSYGNGSAMRVASVGWLYDTIEKTRVVARETARVTHDHIEGLKGAESTASAIFMARNKASKEEIKKYIEQEFHYDLNRTLAQIRPTYHMDETCQKTVPEAIIAFLEAENFEDAIRNAVSLGGDTDTLAAITGSIAEAFYGIPENLIYECIERIDEGKMRDILKEFDVIRKRIEKKENKHISEIDGNRVIEESIDQFYIQNDRDGLLLVMGAMVFRMKQKGEVVVPYISDTEIMSELQVKKMQVGKQFTFDHEVKLKIETVTDATGKEWMGLFTAVNEMKKGSSGNVQINKSLEDMLRFVLEWEWVEGVVINPFGQYLQMPKNLIKALLGGFDNQRSEKDE